MPTGRALTIGLNSVDSGHYAGWSGELQACEADALSMAAIAESKGFEASTLVTKSATRDHVRDDILSAAEDLQSGDHSWPPKGSINSRPTGKVIVSQAKNRRY